MGVPGAWWRRWPCASALAWREAVIARAGPTYLAAVAPRLAAWGVRLDDPAAALARLAAEHGGSVFFPDFAHGALVAALTAMAGAAEDITE